MADESSEDRFVATAEGDRDSDRAPGRDQNGLASSSNPECRAWIRGLRRF
jgi:hypothetical protein